YDFRERIKLNGDLIPEEFVVAFVEGVQPIIKKIEPSFFELTVAMAFQYFAEQKVDVAIIEVGLGGRLDSTNIITPELSVITNIGWDHMNMLGNTLEEIAREKAGIIKDNIPVVIGESSTDTKDVFVNTAKEKNAPIHFASEDFESSVLSFGFNNIQLEVTERKTGKSNKVETDLQGIYQRKNILTALASVNILSPTFSNLSAAVKDGLKQVKSLTKFYGRWDVISNNPTIVLEVAHNRNGIEEMLQHIAQMQFRKLHIVIGMVKDKEVNSLLELLPQNAAYYFTQASIPRALPADDLRQKATKFNLIGGSFANVNDALSDAINAAQKEDVVIVCGSIFLVAEVNRQIV
ncbi:MAG TPA: Mur ligase family protein, partial [Flavisolibacter sp.]|nr:Mur ligase family protein [Flavisolibacter sp.]